MPDQPNEQAARFLGLDLAWKAKNPSGLAALDEAGHLLDLRTDLCEDDAILDWIARWRGSWGAIAIDMPTIVRNAMGQRPCERDLRRDFRAYDAGPYPANRSLEPFRNGGRAAELLTKLAELGVVHACDVAPSDPRTVAFEVFPHPALIRLFGLDRVLLYKNKYPRTWTSVLDAWAEYRRLLGTLETRRSAAGSVRQRPDDARPGDQAEGLQAVGRCARRDMLRVRRVLGVASRHPPAARARLRRDGARAHRGSGPGCLACLSPAGGGYACFVMTKTNGETFLSDVKELRARARENLAKGAVTDNYELDPKQSIELLQNALATEIVCILRYTMHAVAATGIASEGPKSEFAQHAAEERGHMEKIAERINQLGGIPNFNPKGLASRAASEYGASDLDLVGMLKENLIAERIAIEHYRELIQHFGERDSTTRTMLEGILANEEEHANDMHDLLVAHEGTPMLPRD
jgi:bacterioferritin